VSDLPALGRRATLRDVAAAAGVSPATASYTLNGTKPVSDELRRRVQVAAERLGYRGHRAARALRTGRSGALGLVLPDLTNPFYPALAQAIEARARRFGYALMLVDCGSARAAERRGLRLMADHGVDGLVWIPLPGGGDVERPACPTVVIDRSRTGADTVVSDDVAGGALIAARALELGHERVLLLHGPRRATATRRRRQGLLDGLLGRAAVVSELYVPFTTALPPAAAATLVVTDATFVACGSDVIAIGALEALRAAGRRVPAEVSVVGFDDIAWARLVTPALTTVAHAVSDLGAAAVDLILERLRDPQAAPRDRVLPVVLVPRSSDGPAPEKESHPWKATS
jgi:LacI family transcriptional regulator